MFTTRNSRLAIVGVVLVLAGVAVIAVSVWGRPAAHSSTTMFVSGAPVPIVAKVVSIQVDQVSHQVTVRRLAKPKLIEPLPLNQTSLATPMDAMISMTSHLAVGETQQDMDVYAQKHMATPDAFLSLIRSSGLIAKEYWAKVRASQSPTYLLGTVQYSDTVLVVVRDQVVHATTGTKFDHVIGGAFTKHGDSWLLDEERKQNDPVLRSIHDNGYAVLIEANDDGGPPRQD